MKIKKQLVFAVIAGSAVLMLAGCGCLMGPGKSTKPEPAAPKQEPLTLQPEPVMPKKEAVAPQPEPVTLQPEAAPSVEKKKLPRTIQALKPPSDEVKSPTAKVIPKPRKTRCKVRSDAVAWAHVSGGCKNGYAHGKGRAISVDGKRAYAGEFLKGYFSGQGDYDWGDGTVYSGEFNKSRKHGHGSLTYPDKSKYIGEFRNNVYDGDGTYVSADGDAYAGRFQNGHYHGRGTFTWANGNTYAGEFRDDRTVFFQQSFERGRYEFQYLLKVVSPGDFRASPARIAAMYVPEGTASSAAQNVVVTSPSATAVSSNGGRQ